jgi:hypothetical protein
MYTGEFRALDEEDLLAESRRRADVEREEHGAP